MSHIDINTMGSAPVRSLTETELQAIVALTVHIELPIRHYDQCGFRLHEQSANRSCNDCRDLEERERATAVYWKEVNREALITSPYYRGGGL